MAEKTGHKKLTPKQAAFVREYLIDLNAAAAARRAGYSEKTAKEIGFEHLTKPHIQAAINAEQDARAKRTKITQDYVLAEIKEVFEDAKQRAAEGMADRTNALKALDMLARHVGLFEKDNSQKKTVISVPDWEAPS
jgi:phage terminase small subunit